MNNTGKKLSIAAAALIVVLVAAIGVFAAWTIGVSVSNIQKNGAASEVSIFDFDGTPVASDEAARIIEADSKYPLGAKIETYDNGGSRIALDEVDPGAYEGFMASVNVQDESAKAKMQSALDSGAVNYVTDDIVSAVSLDVLSQFFTEDDLGSIGPDYKIYPLDVEEGDGAETETVAPENEAVDQYAGAYAQKDLERIKAASAWSAGLTGKGVTIGIIDGGLMGTGGNDLKHEDIDYSKVLPGLDCTLEAETSGTTSTPDGAGHGTFVAGEIIAAHNDKGVDGIAPDANVRPYKVFKNDGSGVVSNVTRAVNQAIKDDVDIATMSLGSVNESQFTQSLFTKAVDAGMILIAACGNDANNVNHYPAAFGAVVGVSSVFADNGEFSDHYFGSAGDGSVYGNDNVYVSAPGCTQRGSGIWGIALSTTSNNGYKTLAGTSMSAPYVAGFAALAKQKYNVQGVDLDQAAFKQVLRDTVQDKDGNHKTTYDDKYGWGTIDCGRLASNGKPDELLASGTINGVDWTISDDTRELVLSPASGVRGTLNISVGSQAPWNAHAASIKSVTVIAGVDAGSNLALAFNGLSSCASIDLGNMAAGSVSITRGMFDGCSSLTSVVLPANGIGSTNTPVTNIREMFNGCASLRALDLSGLCLGSRISADGVADMFTGCTLEAITLPANWPSGITIKPATGKDSLGHDYNGKWLSASGVEVANPTASGAYTASVTHVPGEPVIVPATCATTGTSTTKCTICDEIIGTDVLPIDPNSHQWGAITWVWADDNSSATATRTCEYDAAHKETKTENSTSQTVGNNTTYTVTVTFDGEPMTVTKTVAGSSGEEGHVHTWGEGTVTTAATCTTFGKKTSTCSGCGATQTEDIPALGHKMVEDAGTGRAPDCTNDGMTPSMTCANGCGEKRAGTILPALGHDMVEVAGSAKAPTCTEPGTAPSKECSRKCGKTEAGEAIPALGHNMVEVAGTAKPADCVNDGIEATLRCSNGCGTEQAGKVIPALGHSFKTVVTKAATCTEPGTQHEACEREGCAVVKEGSEKEIAALGHEWSEPVWQWNDAKLAADAKFVCARDESHTETVKADIDSKWGEDNAIERTATVKHHDKEFTDTAVVRSDSFKSVEVNAEAADAGFDASISGIPADSKVELNVDPVSEGEVHDAIVKKASGNAFTILAGIYDINLKINDEPKDSDFGTLTLVFPVNEQFNGKPVTIHHCHGNDASNIESTDGYVVEDGKVVVKDVTKLSTFAVEVTTADGQPLAPQPTNTAVPNNAAVGGGFAVTGDQMALIVGVLAVVGVAAVAAALYIIVFTRRSKKK